jgi:hypothetical protein
MSRAFQINSDDNVATLLADVPAGATIGVVGGVGDVCCNDAIVMGHKIAISPIAAGAAVVKFGITIGRATRPIAAGEWVHLHNMASDFDQRSKTLDVQTGAVTDTKYE